MHLANGQEPTAAGVCAHLTPDDFITATHRLYHFAIAKSVYLNSMTAVLFLNLTFLSGGLGCLFPLFHPLFIFSFSVFFSSVLLLFSFFFFFFFFFFSSFFFFFFIFF